MFHDKIGGVRRHLPILVCLASLLACGDDPVAPPRPPTVLAFVGGTVVDDRGVARIDFGSVGVGNRARLPLVVENRTDRELPLDVASLAPPFAFVEPPAATLPPRGRQSLLLSFEPTEVGAAEARLALRTKGGALEARLVGQGVEASTTCDYLVHPAAVRLTVGELGAAWRFPLTLEVLEGPCVLEEVGVEGGLEAEVDATEGLVVLPGMRAPLELRIAAPHAGASGAVTLVMGGKKVTVPVEVEEEPRCAEEAAPVSLADNFRCPTGTEVRFSSRCDEPLEIASARLWPEDASDNFGLRTVHGQPNLLEISYVAQEAVGPESAWAIVDFTQGDRLVVPLEGEARLEEDRFVVPTRSLDLLLVIDKGSAMVAHASSLGPFVERLAGWLEETHQDVRIGVTTSGFVADEDCPAEEGELLPVDAPEPRYVSNDTPDPAGALRRALAIDHCAARHRTSAWMAAREALLHPRPPWLRTEARKVVVIFSAEEDTLSPILFATMVMDLGTLGVEQAFTVGPAEICGDTIGSWAPLAEVAASLSGRSFPICAPETWEAIVDEIEQSARGDYVFDLSREAHGTREADGVTLRADGAPIPSTGSLISPAWSVDVGKRLRLQWGLPPGTDLLLRYPAKGSVCL